MTNLLQLTLFGSPEVRLHGQAVTGFRTSKAQALFYYLVANDTHRMIVRGYTCGKIVLQASRTGLYLH